jgi:drug/metabolite transporter (DMT)-like permease
MLTVVLGLGSALGYAVHDFLMVKVVRAAAVWTALCWSMGTGLVILLPLALILDGPPSGPAEWRAAGFAAASGLCEAAALACLLRGLVTGNLSIVTPLASLAGGFVAVIAVIGGEALSTPALIGLPVAVAGGLLASVEKAPAEEVFRLDEGGPEAAPGAPVPFDPSADAGVAPAATTPADPTPVRRRQATAGAGWALLSSVLFAVVVFLMAEATALHAVAIAAYGRLGTIVVLVPVALLLAGLRLPRPLAGRCATAGVFDAAAFVAFAAAITIGPIAVASVVLAQGGTMAVLLGYLLLHERLSRVQYAGVACTCVAVTLFAIG